jgi:nucleotide-binding universal stress UspA family protein
VVRFMNAPVPHSSKHKVIVGVKDKQVTALRFAARVAVARGAGLRIIHCVDVPSVVEFVTTPNDVWRSTGQGVLDDAAAALGDEIPPSAVEYELDDGPPYNTLLEEAIGGALMVVVGADTTGWFEDLRDGSVAHRLASHSPVPVATVPEHAWAVEDTGTVVVAIDGRSAATGPLRFAFEEASRRQADLHVVHIVPEKDMFHRSMSHRLEVAEVLAGWSEEFPDVRVTRRLLFDEADEGTVRASEEASLLILGRRSETGISRLLGHPVLAEVTRRVHCPCVVVPDEAE